MTKQKKFAEKALATKASARSKATHLKMQTPTAGDGPLKSLNTHEPVMGAFDAEGHRPVLERSRKVR